MVIILKERKQARARIKNTRLWPATFTLFLYASLVNAFDFFQIKSICYIEKPSHKQSINIASGGKFVPHFEVVVTVKKTVKAEQLFAKAYFYDRDRKLITKQEKPTPVFRNRKQAHSMPVFFKESENVELAFVLPEKVQSEKNWRVLFVFGDKSGAAVKIYPSGIEQAYDFPEADLAFGFQQHKQVKREIIRDPITEFVYKTNNKYQPQITFFARAPLCVDKFSEVKGVLALCLLANNVPEIKRRLQLMEKGDEVGGLLRFANTNRLAVICWGSKSLWDPRQNWDDLDSGRYKAGVERFNSVAESWKKGIFKFTDKTGLPKNRYLLWGSSGSAQYAARLALREPEMFSAVHIHIPSSFDKPTASGRNILWCLTTGENESGYERSLRFYSECRKLGYPILYKAYPALAHSGHPAAERLGLEFFRYALQEIGRTKKLDKPKADREPVSPSQPTSVADIINQEVYPLDKEFLIPEPFRTYLHTPELAESWINLKVTDRTEK